MRKKLLAGVMALALCSTNMPPQTIFAGEFTSGNLEEVTEETPEIFSDDNQEVIEETEEELSVFSSENVPEFSSEVNVMSATAGETEPIEINMENKSGTYYDSTNNLWIIKASGSYRFNGNGTGNNDDPIIIQNIDTGTVKIYLNNVSINAPNKSALLIEKNVNAQVYIYLQNNNKLSTSNYSAACLQKNNIANLTIDNAPNTTTTGSLTVSNNKSGAGIGGGNSSPGNNITISGGSITASSNLGAGIGGGYNGSCDDITISGGSVNASSNLGAGIGGGSNGSGKNITISGGSVTASSTNGAGIGGGYNGSGSNITISGGSVNAKIGCTPHQRLNSSGSYDPKSPEVYRCDILNTKNQIVKIDNQLQNPYNHSALDSGNTNLYAWLTGKDHIVTIGNERRSYIFNSDSKSFTQGKRTATVDDFVFTPPSTTSLTYDGQPKSVDVRPRSGINGMGNITVNYFLEDTLITGFPVNAGTYTVKINIDEGDFYDRRTDLTDNNWKFTINPAPISITGINITPYSGTYDGKPHKVISSVQDYPDGCTVKYSIDRENWNDDCPTVESVADAANTSVYIQISKENYTPWTSKPQNATISPKDISDSDIKITPYSGTYDGKPHKVISSVQGYPDGCTVKYSIDRENWNDDCPTIESVADAANTSVYIQISKENYTPWTSKPQNATISPKDISDSDIKITPYSGTYDGKPHKVISSVQGYPDGCTVKYSIDRENWNDDCPTIESVADAANTSVYIQISKENYTPWTSKPQNATISPKDISDSDIKITPYSGTYDGKPHKVISSVQGYPDGCTVKYSIDRENWNDDCPTIESVADAANTSVYIQISKENYTPWTSKTQSATISPKDISDSDIKITPYSGTYDGGPHAAILSVIGCPEDCTIRYSTDNKTWTNDCPNVKSVEDATNTSVYIQISKENYTTWTSDPQKANISPKNITIEINDLEKIYGTDNPELTFKVPDSKTQLAAGDTIESLDIKLKTTAETSSPVKSSGYPITLESCKNKNYNVTANSGALKVNPAAEAPNLPSDIDTKISVSWFCKKVGDITNILPEHWIWKNTDKSKELKVEEPISADAVYNGTDKGNYVTETVTYTITRSKCEHKHTAGRYYSSPSCTSSGYSGDTYCKDCNETLSYGYTISAYGHDYDNGVITTEPTAETDGIITYTCKRCKHQDTKNLGKLGDGEPYIEGSFQKKGWEAVNDLIKASKEKDTISITLNGSRLLPASVLSGIKGKDISLNLDMENGFIWKINGTSITAETPADTDLSVTNTAEYIPAALYSLISTNQNDFGFHLGRNGAFNFPAVLSVKADASCAGLMANLFWYDAENGVMQCIQTVTVGGAFERSIPYADFTLSKGQDYFIAFGTESLNGRVIHTDGSITDENGAYLRPANTKISSYSIDRNKLTVKLSKGCAGAQGYDFVISKKSNMLQTGKFSKKVSSTGKPQASFRYLAKGTWYVAARSWVLDAQGNKVYGSWTKIKKIKITVITPQQPKIRNITVEGNTVTITYTKCKNAIGYEILLGNKYKTSAGEKYPVKKYLKRTEGKNTVTVTFTNVKKGTWYVTVRSWNKTSKNKSRVYSPYSDIKKFKVKK